MAAIVTGGAQGIGASICVALLQNGYKVCVADIQNSRGLHFVEEQQKRYGKDNIFFSLCDVKKEADYIRTFNEAIAAYQTVDLLVNNAGISGESNPREIIDVNLMGPIFGCKAALKFMGKSSGGKGGMVINVASLLGVIPSWIRPVYTASKHGIIGLTRSYGQPQHEHKEGIIFAALCPSLTDTDIIKPTEGREENAEDFSKQNDILMSPDYVAQGAMKLLKDRINGSTLLVSKVHDYRYIEHQKKINNIPLQ